MAALSAPLIDRTQPLKADPQKPIPDPSPATAPLPNVKLDCLDKSAHASPKPQNSFQGHRISDATGWGLPRSKFLGLFRATPRRLQWGDGAFAKHDLSNVDLRIQTGMQPGQGMFAGWNQGDLDAEGLTPRVGVGSGLEDNDEGFDSEVEEPPRAGTQTIAEVPNVVTLLFDTESEEEEGGALGRENAHGKKPLQLDEKEAGLGVQITDPKKSGGKRKQVEASPTFAKPLQKKVATSVSARYKQGRCADCGTEDSSVWHLGAGGPRTRCRKCHHLRWGGPCHLCGSQKTCMWYSGAKGPKTTCSKCYGKFLRPRKDSASGGARRTFGGGTSAQQAGTVKAGRRRGIPLDAGLVSRRVEIWWPLDKK